MSLPDLRVEMDLVAIRGGGFTLDDPVLSLLDSGNVLDFADPTWSVDLTPYVRGFSLDRGASNETEFVGAGTASIRLDNLGGRFTPSNTGSPYFPNIVPMRRIRIFGGWPNTVGGGTYDSGVYDDGVYGGSATWYPRYMGYVEEWPFSFPGEMDSIVEVQLVDGFDLIGMEGVAVSGDFPAQSSSERVTALLDAIGWSPSLRAIETGTVTVPAITLDNVKPLEHIQQIEFAEQGRFFMDGAGNACFRKRGNSGVIQATWADDGSGLPYRSSIAPKYGRQYIRNDFRLSRTGGAEQVSANTTSQHEFGTRSFARQDVQLSTDGEVLSLADYLNTTYAFPIVRIDNIDDLAMAHDQWDQVLALDLNDAVNVKESRLGISQVSSVQRIHDEYDGESWSISFQVAPTVLENYARLDDSAFRLDDNFVLGR